MDVFTYCRCGELLLSNAYLGREGGTLPWMHAAEVLKDGPRADHEPEPAAGADAARANAHGWNVKFDPSLGTRAEDPIGAGPMTPEEIQAHWDRVAPTDEEQIEQLAGVDRAAGADPANAGS